jgi:hypothetical protein
VERIGDVTFHLIDVLTRKPEFMEQESSKTSGLRPERRGGAW